MLKNTILLAVLCFAMVCFVPQDANAQKTKLEKSKTEKSQKKGDEEKTKKVLERPANAGASSIDAFVTKSFDAYDESLKLSKDIEFIKVTTNEIPDAGDGVTTKTIITNGDGETITAKDALLQLKDLLISAKKQSDNIAAIQALQKPATNELKTCKPKVKAKATKSLSKGTKALAQVASESLKQIELIGKQISLLNELKDN